MNGRQNNFVKRGRNQRRRQGVNINRSLDSNGPDVRIRGTANQIYEKYLTLARDASTSGDRVKAENYLQHAEHYFRVIRAMAPAVPGQPDQSGDGDFEGDQPTVSDFDDRRPQAENGSSNGEQGARGEGGGGQGYDRQNGDRGNGDRFAGDRPQHDRQNHDRSGNDRSGNDRFGNERSGERPGNERFDRPNRGQERQGSDRSRDSAPGGGDRSDRFASDRTDTGAAPSRQEPEPRPEARSDGADAGAGAEGERNQRRRHRPRRPPREGDAPAVEREPRDDDEPAEAAQ